IRERDLMMPQEVRQMPSERMILLIEGQPSIFAGKLRFHEIAAFKNAAEFSLRHPPPVPEVDFVAPRPVPALATKDPALLDLGTNPPDRNPLPASDIPLSIARSLSQSIEDGRLDELKRPPGPRQDARDSRIAEMESAVKASAERLTFTVAAKIAGAGGSVRSRASIDEILRQTVPDPADLGIASVT
ncbi:MULTISPECIES: type IV secretory system conjugative DNA transfer family protein, partial [unclassified Neorhizobium]|uniref:type IV secretory system conjugative DNA transfer family protein n=1 Tax=unclassified Neorhizobium TaxID=2629175 RepID=UPI001FF62BE6